MVQDNKPKKLECPYCGYKMPIVVLPNAVCKGLKVKCKGRNCGKEFEIKIKDEEIKNKTNVK